MVTALMAVKFIPFCTASNSGREILNIGTAWHKKGGHPNMGGLHLHFGTLVSIGLSREGTKKLARLRDGTFFAIIGFGTTTQVVKKRNLGLRQTKLLLQILVAVAYLVS
jgi:UDP-N-acetylmuramyl pentapeptide phosphotransferase/UDP-N-acetylglucosamine-1-phosphate transferase